MVTQFGDESGIGCKGGGSGAEESERVRVGGVRSKFTERDSGKGGWMGLAGW